MTPADEDLETARPRRLPCCLPVWVKTPDGLLFAELTDLSAGGAFVEGVQANVGDELELVLRWLHSGELCLRAEVCHVKPRGVGVRFVDDDAVAKLVRLMPGARV